MKRQADEGSIENRLKKTIKRAFKVTSEQKKLPRLIDNIIYFIVTRQYKQLADYIVDNITPLNVYRLHIALKDMNIPNFDVDIVYKQENIWGKKLRKFLHPIAYGILVDHIQKAIGQDNYSPKWLFWSTFFLLDELNGNVNPQHFEFTFEKAGPMQNGKFIKITYRPSELLVQIKKFRNTRIAQIDDFTIDNNSISEQYSINEIKLYIPPFDPAGPNISPVYQVIVILYQMFRKNYMLLNMKQYDNNTDIYVSNKCVVCNNISTHKCINSECNGNLYCSEKCHENFENNKL